MFFRAIRSTFHKERVPRQQADNMATTSKRFLSGEHQNFRNAAAKAAMLKKRKEARTVSDQGALTMAEASRRLNRMRVESEAGISKFDDKGSLAIADPRAESESVQKLSITNSDIGDEGAKAIATSLKQNTSLKVLSIRSSHIGDIGAKANSDMLQENKSLQELYLHGCSHGHVFERET